MSNNGLSCKSNPCRFSHKHPCQHPKSRVIASIDAFFKKPQDADKKQSLIELINTKFNTTASGVIEKARIENKDK